MPAVKDVVRHLTTEVAGRRRKCYRQPLKHTILKGEICLTVKDGPQQTRTYCQACAREIIELAQGRLSELALKLSNDLQEPSC